MAHGPSGAAGASTTTLDRRSRPHHRNATAVASSALLTVGNHLWWAFATPSLSGRFFIIAPCSSRRPRYTSLTIELEPLTPLRPPWAWWPRRVRRVAWATQGDSAFGARPTVRGPWAKAGLALCARGFSIFVFVYYSWNSNKLQKSIENTIKLRKIQSKFL
jgi:hypothetical protein